MKLTFHCPALFPACLRASCSPLRAGPVCALTAPFSGRSEQMSIVLAPPLLPELPELPERPLEALLALLLAPLEPQAAIASAAAATAAADIALRSLMFPPLLTPKGRFRCATLMPPPEESKAAGG